MLTYIFYSDTSCYAIRCLVFANLIPTCACCKFVYCIYFVLYEYFGYLNQYQLRIYFTYKKTLLLPDGATYTYRIY